MSNSLHFQSVSHNMDAGDNWDISTNYKTLQLNQNVTFEFHEVFWLIKFPFYKYFVNFILLMVHFVNFKLLMVYFFTFPTVMYQMESFDICYPQNAASQWKTFRCANTIYFQRKWKWNGQLFFPFRSRWSMFFVSLCEAIYLLHVKPIPSCLLCNERFDGELWTSTACTLPSRF